jgi:hypothetical protein
MNIEDLRQKFLVTEAALHNAVSNRFDEDSACDLTLALSALEDTVFSADEELPVFVEDPEAPRSKVLAMRDLIFYTWGHFGGDAAIPRAAIVNHSFRMGADPRHRQLVFGLAKVLFQKHGVPYSGDAK